MAIWQVDFYLVPRRALTASSDISPTALGETDWWAGVAFPSDYQKRLDNVARRGPSASPDCETWGREDENRVDVWSEDGRVRRAMARIDVRRLDSRFGAALLDFVRATGAVLIRRDGMIVEPTVSGYATALRTSDAWKFASDPAAHFASYSNPDDDE